MRPRDLFALAYRIAQSAMSGLRRPQPSPVRKERTFPTAWQIRQIDPKIDRKLAFGHRLRRTHVNEWRGARPPVFVLFCMARKGASLEGRGDL